MQSSNSKRLPAGRTGIIVKQKIANFALDPPTMVDFFLQEQRNMEQRQAGVRRVSCAISIAPRHAKEKNYRSLNLVVVRSLASCGFFNHGDPSEDPKHLQQDHGRVVTIPNPHWTRSPTRRERLPGRVCYAQLLVLGGGGHLKTCVGLPKHGRRI